MHFMLTIPTSGHIFINKALDREKKHEYNFYVNAFDAGDPIQFSMARVQVGIKQQNIFSSCQKHLEAFQNIFVVLTLLSIQVKVLDVNDCAPMFRNKTLTATVLESAKKGRLPQILLPHLCNTACQVAGEFPNF